MPKGVCVKVKYLRPRYDNLEEWLTDPSHVLVTRNGRLFITENGERRIFHYPKSPWCNPFSLKQYSLVESLFKYEHHLLNLLRDEDMLQKFISLKDASEIGCFCLPGHKCHRDIILETLNNL